MEAIKKAVETKEMTLDEANEIILQHSRQKNKVLFNSVEKSTEGFNYIIKNLKSKMRLKAKPALNTSQHRLRMNNITPVR